MTDLISHKQTKKRVSNGNTKKSSPPITQKLAPVDIECYNPTNRLLTREFIERVLSKLCGYGVKIGNLETYQTAFVHKSCYKKNLAPPVEAVEKYLLSTNQDKVPTIPPLPIGTYKYNIKSSNKMRSLPVIFTENYEANEFVGDGWIGAVIGQYVRSRFPQQSEKFYHELKKYIVCKDGLSVLSAQLGLGDYALLSIEAEELLTRKNPSLLEDIFESLCCSIVDDLGLGVLRVVVKNLIESGIDFRSAIINDTNYKDILKRLCRENNWVNPEYIELGDNGKFGAKKEFTIGIPIIQEAIAAGVRSKTGYTPNSVKCDLWSTGTGPTKKKAEMDASYNALKCLEIALQTRQ